ncbi:hypothetical protein JCM8208_004595 [Rhodotorula glutinis]
MQSPSRSSVQPTGDELPPPSPGSTRSSRSEHQSTASSTRLGPPTHSRGASTSTATTRSDEASFGEPHERVPAWTTSTAPTSSSSTSSSRPSLPPPPAPLPAAYSHPAIPPAPRRRPLPAPPATSPRFVPLHAPLPPPPPASTSATGRIRQADHVPTVAEEKAAARARAQGLDELLPLLSSQARAGKAVDEPVDDSLASPTSPTGTDLPDYPASPARVALRRSGTTAKRVVERDEEVRGGEDKRALAEAAVRAQVNDEARCTVEEDTVTSKAAFARRAERDEREREEGERRRREREVEKGKGALGRNDDDELDDDDDAPPPISPEAPGREMFPLVDRKDLSSLDDDLAIAPRPPPSATSYRLPPPPVPLPEPASPLSSPSNHCPAVTPADHYFSQPVPPRPWFAAPHSAPLPTPRVRPQPERYTTFGASQLYSGGVASSVSREGSFSPAHGPVRPTAGGRHGSLGPAHSFYSSGVGQVTLKSLEDRQPLAAPALQGSTSSLTLPLSRELDGAAAQHSRRPSWAGSSAAGAPVSSSSAQPREQPSQPHLARSMTASSSMSASSGASYHGGSLSFTSSAPSAPAPWTSSEWRPPPPPPSTAPPPASYPHMAPTSSPAFYTALHPGGPLLPFYAAPSTSPGQPTSSYFSPAGAQGLPPPPAAPVFASLAQSPYAQPARPGAAAFPFPSAAASDGPRPPSSSAGSPAPRHSEATSPRPWSRSSSTGSSAHSPPPVERGAAGAGGGAGAAVREKRMSTIRSLFGRRKGAGARELAGTPEEEDEGARPAGQGWR